MPADFDKCVREGGRVITKNVNDKQYMHICYDKDGKSHSGEVRERSAKANESPAITMLIPVDLSFAELKDGSYELQVLKPGKWDHPAYGMVEITPEIQQEFCDNFEKDLRAHSSSIGLPIDEEHYSDRGATGWIKKLVNKGSEGLFAIVEWNAKGRDLIKNAIYRFFSPEFYFKYEDPEDRRVYNNVLVGGALTNRPYFKGLQPVVLSEKIIHKTMNLKDLVQKSFSELSQEEKDFITTHFNELSVEEQKKFEEAKPQETEEEKTAREAKEKEDKEAADKEAADKAAADKAAADAAANAGVKANEKSVTMNEKDVLALKEQAAKGVEATEKLKKLELNERVTGFIYSENNKENGKLPAALKDQVIEFAATLSEDQVTKFFALIKGMPSATLFAELGAAALEANDGKTAPKGVSEESFALDLKAKELMKADDKMTYQEALVKAEAELAKK